MQSDWVEMTRYWFLHRNTSFPKSAIYGTFTHTVGIEPGKNTLFALDDGSNQLPVGIGISNSLPFN